MAGSVSLRSLCVVLFSLALVPTILSAATLRVGHPSIAVTSADPFARDEGGGIRFAIYDGLTRLTRTGVMEPSLAVSWDTEDDTTWVFKLRDGVMFSNGEPFTAAAVVSTFDALFDSSMNHGRANDIITIESYAARDDLTVEIKTKVPDPLLPKRFNQLPIIEPKSYAEMGHEQYSRTPVGTGPYNIESWGSNNSRPVLVATGTSWREVKHYDRIEKTVITDPGARISGLLSGRLDFTISLASDDIPTLEAAGMKVSVLSNPSILAIALRTVREDDSPIKDARVRRALNYAVNKQAIVDYILGGTTRVAHQPSAPGLIGYNPDAEPFDYSPEKARELLAEAGYTDGIDLKFSVYGGILPGDTLIFQQVAQDLGAVGVNVELRQISFPDYVRRLFNADWEDIDGFSIGWMNLNLWDPQKAYEQFSCGYSAPFYCDEEAMPLIEAAGVEMDPIKREELLKDVVLRLRDQGASIWLTEMSGAVAHIKGMTLNDFRIDGSAYANMTYEEP